jgi:3',5'-cyclic AMP phosphodiesterase CpdA
MRLTRGSLALAFGLGLAVGCGALLAGRFPARIDAAVAGPPEQVPWTGLDALTDPDEFRFVVVTDRTGEHRDGVFEAAMPKINLVRPEFVVSVGDLIEGYTDDAALLDREWDEIEGFVGRLGMPFFYVPGNHDMSNAVMAGKWQERFGPSYYHFSYRGVLFLALNSELFGMVHDPRSSLPGPWTQADQLAFVERVLAENRGARWTFVLIHQPLWDSPRPNPDWQKVEALLAERPHTVFAGHFHRYTEQRRGGNQYITLATTGGGSRLRGTPWGEFDHVAQVTMTKQGPVIANLRLDGILPADVVTTELRTLVQELENAVVAEPLVGNGRYFDRGTARFSIANPGASPLDVWARFEPSRDLVPAKVDERVSIAPGGVATVELPLRARAPRAYETLTPARARFELATRDLRGEALSLERELAVLPERRFEVARSERTPRVDGDLSEWGRLPIVVEEPAGRYGHGLYRGPEDASFRFGVRHDGEFLYLAVDVRDDSIVASPDRVAREQDHVALSLDARPDPERSKNEPTFVAIRSGAMAKLVSPLIALQETRPDPVLRLFAAGAPDRVRSAVRRTTLGYALEVAVPAAVLDERRGARWDALRVNVTLADFDEDENDHVLLSWRPSRFESGAIEGAGTFVRR